MAQTQNPLARNRPSHAHVPNAVRILAGNGINKGEFEMNITTKLSLASLLLLSFAAPLQAQSPKQGDYYAPGQASPQQLSPAQQQRIQQGDYYAPGQTAPQRLSPGQEQRLQQGDYYKPDSK
ncbi:MAG: hypothetical protein WBE48_11670 [Xanthobacteraceae bacterium]